jgi:3-oxoacyl-[acyl-carrier protein] reductase
MDHAGRAALVTGGAQGIGREYALGLAAQGASVAVIDINEAGAKETADLISSNGGRAAGIGADVSDAADVAAAVDAACRALGDILILVNNAAIYHDLQLKPLLEVDLGYWRRNFAVNLDGALLFTQCVAPMMKRAGWGRVVMQSTAGAYSNTGGHYAASKLALVNLTKGFARELGPSGITVNAIAPGVILTEATLNTLPEEAIERLIASQLVPVRARASDLVPVLQFLCSEGARFITGQTLLVDGGLTQRV